MSKVSRIVPVPRERVYEILADGWSYAGWVVGNAHIREVDDDWPAEGSGIHHKAGVWPIQVPDVSTVVALEPDRMLEIDARLWLLGRARIRVTLEPIDEERTRVTIEERAVRGPASVVPSPMQALLLNPRNNEALARLQDIAVGRAKSEEKRRAHGAGGDSPPT